MKTKKRILSMVAAVLMVVTMLPGMVFAEADPDITKPVPELDTLQVACPNDGRATVGDTITVSINLSDDRGVDRAYITFTCEEQLGNRTVHLSYAGDDPEQKSGSWQGEFTVDDQTENGLWIIEGIQIRDTSGNNGDCFNSKWNSGMLPNSDLSAFDFEVYGTSSDPDITKPVPELDTLQVACPNDGRATVGDTITVSINLSDDRGVDRAYITFTCEEQLGNRTVHLSYAGDDPEQKSGSWQGEFTVDDQTENGLWIIEGIQIRDTSGNNGDCFNSKWNSGMLPNSDLSAFDFEVYGTSSDPDITKPVPELDTLQVACPNDGRATVGDTITVSINLSDDRGVDRAYITFTCEEQLGNRTVHLSYAGDDPEQKSGSWQGEFTVDDQTENGLWIIEGIQIRDTSGNNGDCFNSKWNSGMLPNSDLSAFDFEVTSPECPLDLTTEGYSMMLNGAGATTTFGGNYYVNSADDTVTPSVKVRFDADDGTWNTLSPRKYTLKYEKKTSEDTWEDYMADTFGVDQSGTATYRVSAIGKESLYYTGTVGPVEFNVIKKHKVTFDTRGGSGIDPQYIIPGEKASEPAEPTKDMSFFAGWYADEDLTEPFDFSTAINDDITIYADWNQAVTLTIGVYDRTNSVSGQGGTYIFNAEDTTHTLDRHSVPVGSAVSLAAAPAEGYMFDGWYLGSISGSGDTLSIKPLGDSFKPEPTIQLEAYPGYAAYAICAVFREISDTPPEIDISTLQIQPPEERQADRILTAGDSVSVSVKITDNGTVKKALAWFLNEHEAESEEDEYYIAVEKIILSGQDNDMWTGTFEIDGDTETGVWKLGYVEAQDDNNNEVGFYNSASYYEEEFSPYADLSACDFQVKEGYTVTFDSNGGSDVATQRVIAGRKAAEPEDPTREGWYFGDWYTDEAMTEEYNFYAPVTRDLTLYGNWYTYMAMGVYNRSNPDNGLCGTVDIETARQEYNYQDARTMNFTVPEGPMKFTAKPAEGYLFKGWYKGVVGSSYFVETPSDELLCEDPVYTCDAAGAEICAVFECGGHQWEQKVQKATPDADGRIYQKCAVCGIEENAAPLMKISSIDLEKTSYTYTGKAIKPKVIAAAAGEELSADHYTVKYKNNTEVGTAVATVTFNSEWYEGSRELTFKIKPAATASFTASNQKTGIKLTWKQVAGATGYYIYRNGTKIKNITSGSTLTYNDTKATDNGTKYTYKIKAYASTGTSTLAKYRTIYGLKRPAITSLTNSGAGKMTVKWEKNTSGSGYEVQYSRYNSFSSKKTVNLASKNYGSKAITGLTKGKTYYVRVRTYRTVGSKKYYSAWSPTKSVKVAK